MALNPDKLNEFLGKAVVDFGATMSAALIRIGDRLGLYKALVSGGPQTPAELAEKAGVARATITGLVDTLERDGIGRRVFDEFKTIRANGIVPSRCLHALSPEP